jgi:DNA (cytosine-5)-methyltransferase 1
MLIIFREFFMKNKIITVSDTRAYKQFGNSVAVPVVRAIARNMIVEMNTLPVR